MVIIIYSSNTSNDKSNEKKDNEEIKENQEVQSEIKLDLLKEYVRKQRSKYEIGNKKGLE